MPHRYITRSIRVVDIHSQSYSRFTLNDVFLIIFNIIIFIYVDTFVWIFYVYTEECDLYKHDNCYIQL